MGFIDYEVDGAVGIITINRPKALNALNEDVLKQAQARSLSLQAQTSVL